MKPTTSPNKPDAHRGKAAQEAAQERAREKPAADDASADVTGGAPATEEDIGTEGAGTEARETAQPKRHPQSPSARR